MEDVLEISLQLMKNLIFLKAVLNSHLQDIDDVNLWTLYLQYRYFMSEDCQF